MKVWIFFIYSFMKYLKLFESFIDFFEEINIDRFKVEKMKAINIDEKSNISKKMIEDFCDVSIKQKDFSRRLNTNSPNWRPEMGTSRNFSELQIDYQNIIINQGEPINKKLILNGEIDIYILPEEFFLVRFYRKWEGDNKYWNKFGEEVTFYLCDQLDGLKILIDEIYNRRID